MNTLGDCALSNRAISTRVESSFGDTGNSVATSLGFQMSQPSFCRILATNENRIFSSFLKYPLLMYFRISSIISFITYSRYILLLEKLREQTNFINKVFSLQPNSSLTNLIHKDHKVNTFSFKPACRGIASGDAGNNSSN